MKRLYTRHDKGPLDRCHRRIVRRGAFGAPAVAIISALIVVYGCIEPEEEADDHVATGGTFGNSGSVGITGGSDARPDGGASGSRSVEGDTGNAENAGSGGASMTGTEAGAPATSGGAGGSGGDAGGGAGGASQAGAGAQSGTAGAGSTEEGGIGGCVKAVFGRYVLRTDGALIYQGEAAGVGQPGILDAETALPLAGVVEASEGYLHGCAVLDDGTAACWRTAASGNSVGQLGSGDTDTSGALYRATRVLVGPDKPLKNVVALAQGTTQTWGTSSCAITGEGQLYCWGDVTWIIDEVKTTPYALPLTSDGVTPFTGVVQASIGSDGTNCAVVQEDGESQVYCWGYNAYGQLATGDTMNRAYPTPVLGVSDPSKVVTFGWGPSVCALSGDNVYCWGNNAAGVAGPSTTSANILTPTRVTLMGGMTALEGIVDIVGASRDVQQGVGVNSVCALGDDGVLKCWGATFEKHPTNYSVVDIVAVGDMNNNTPRTLTSDGLYHIGTTSREVNCGLL